MDVVKKIAFYAIGILLLGVTFFLFGKCSAKGEIDQRAVDTRNAVEQLSESNKSLRILNRRFEVSNANLERIYNELRKSSNTRLIELGKLKENLIRSNGIIEKLRDAIGGSSATVSDIIGTVHRIRIIIEGL
jgi:hypothetical protein